MTKKMTKNGAQDTSAVEELKSLVAEAMGEPDEGAKVTKVVAKRGRPKVEKAPKPIRENACLICGKDLTQEKSRIRGIGPVCWDRISKNLGPDAVERIQNLPDAEFGPKVDELKAILKATDVGKRIPVEQLPAGYMKLGDVMAIAARKGLAPSAVFRAMGGNRFRNPPKEGFGPVFFCGRARWLPGTCLAHLDELRKPEKDVTAAEAKATAKAAVKAAKIAKAVAAKTQAAEAIVA